MYSCGPLHKNEQGQDDKLEPSYSSSADTGCSPEDLPKAMDDREGWRERVSVLMVRYDDDDDDI